MPVALQLCCDFVAVTLYPWQQAEHVLQDDLGVMEIPAVRSDSSIRSRCSAMRICACST